MPNLYIIGGCNGAGKTTASYTILPEILECKEFVNADEIARGISPFNYEKVSFEAGRIMLNRVNELAHQKVDFALETTLATKSYASLIKKLKQNDYTITLIFFWLNSFELAKERVAERVKHGGHNIPLDVIERRYVSGLRNLNKIFLPLVDNWIIYDSSSNPIALVAKKQNQKEAEIFENQKFKNIIKND